MSGIAGLVSGVDRLGDSWAGERAVVDELDRHHPRERTLV